MSLFEYFLFPMLIKWVISARQVIQFYIQIFINADEVLNFSFMQIGLWFSPQR